MNLLYGSYSHDPSDAEVTITREAVVSELGIMYAVKERWSVNGRLHAATTALTDAAVEALMAAYSINGQDISLAGSSRAMRSSDTINGTRVVSPPHFPVGTGAEYTTFRSYSLAVEGEFAYAGPSILLSWQEVLNFKGQGGPKWGFLECLNGPPQLQQFSQYSVFHVTQRGSAVCVPASKHRNEYGDYWLPPPPCWPQWEHTDRHDVTYDLPADLYGKRVTHWAYEFSANIPLGAFPNATAGIIFHLG